MYIVITHFGFDGQKNINEQLEHIYKKFVKGNNYNVFMFCLMCGFLLFHKCL